MIELVAGAFIIIGLLFFLAGTAGLLRFPDIYSRLHAVTKADNAGLGMLAIGMALLADSWRLVLLIALVWVVAVTASSVACHLVARHHLREEGEG